MSRSFFFGANPITKQVKKQEAVAEIIIDGLKAELGLTDQHLQQGRAMMGAIGGNTRANLEQHGARDYEKLKGEYYRVGSVRQEGDRRITEVFRMNGPQVEKAQIVEEKVSDRSWVHVEDRGLA
jgi:hypothetical protein